MLYILSANIERRHLSKGQRAMLTAILFPDPEKGGRGKKNEARNVAETARFSYRRLAELRLVQRHLLFCEPVLFAAPVPCCEKKPDGEKEENSIRL